MSEPLSVIDSPLPMGPICLRCGRFVYGSRPAERRQRVLIAGDVVFCVNCTYRMLVDVAGAVRDPTDAERTELEARPFLVLVRARARFIAARNERVERERRLK
jgi:DNA-directed RNA polymerase subunit RPC12/RpoP